MSHISSLHRRHIRIVLQGSEVFIRKTARGLDILMPFSYPNGETSVIRVDEKETRARTIEGFAREVISHAIEEAHNNDIQLCAYAAPFLVPMNGAKDGRKALYPVVVVAAYSLAGTGDVVMAPYAPLKVPAHGIRTLLHSQARAQKALRKDGVIESEETKRLAGLVAVFIQGQPDDPFGRH